MEERAEASLVIRTQTIGSRTPEVTYNLYTDSGDLYVTDTPKALPTAIAHHDSLADGSGLREVAAARYAETGDLTTARKRMVDATTNPFGLGLSPIPEVTVASSVTGGQPTLTLTAGSALFGGGSPQVLTVNAKTGMPLRSVMDARGNEPSSVTSYQVSRVTLAGIESGRF